MGKWSKGIIIRDVFQFQLHSLPGTIDLHHRLVVYVLKSSRPRSVRAKKAKALSSWTNVISSFVLYQESSIPTNKFVIYIFESSRFRSGQTKQRHHYPTQKLDKNFPQLVPTPLPLRPLSIEPQARVHHMQTWRNESVPRSTKIIPFHDSATWGRASRPVKGIPSGYTPVNLPFYSTEVAGFLVEIGVHRLVLVSRLKTRYLYIYPNPLLE